MSDILNVTLVQSDLHWEDPASNRETFMELFQKLESPTNLIVLPEMFTTGFSMNARNLAEEHEGHTLEWMQTVASAMNTAITGSVIVKDQGRFYNRLYFVLPDSSYHWYDKRHTFTLAGEHRTYTSGTDKLIVDYNGWKICPLICYDLRFPVWARNTEGYDLLIYVANWPKKRVAAWDALLKARAIENMSYCIGVNRVGFDGNQHEYTGHSAIYDVLGEAVSDLSLSGSFVQQLDLNKDHIATTRKQLRFLDDRDSFSLV